MEKFQITEPGYKRLKAEVENLKNVERPNIIKQIAAARELGDLKENAEYHTAKDRQGFVVFQSLQFLHATSQECLRLCRDRHARNDWRNLRRFRGNQIAELWPSAFRRWFVCSSYEQTKADCL